MNSSIEFPKGVVAQGYNAKKVTTLILVSTVCIALILSHTIIGFEENSPMALAVNCAIFLTIIAAATLAFQLKEPHLKSSGATLTFKTVEFNQPQYEKVTEAISKNSWDEILSIEKSDSGISMKIELVYSKDKSFMAYQIFKYVPHTYQPYCPLTYLNKTEL